VSSSNQSNREAKVKLHDPYAALRFRDYRLFAIGYVSSMIGQQMQSVAIGWELYERTNSAMVLGVVGLVQALPIIVLTLPAGQVIDWFNRKHVVLMAELMLAVSSIGLAVLSYTQGAISLIYACLLLSGVARAFNQPAMAALLPSLVPIKAFSNAVTWKSSGFQIASVVGPALGGLVIGILHSATLVYVVNVILAFTCFGFISIISARQSASSKSAVTLNSLAAGVNFVWQTKVILAAITLDLFAVLLGGATTLLPIFAKDILHVGPTGLGWLRAAPAIGAFLMAVIIAHLPPMQRAGKTMLWAVAGFGVATIVIGISHSFWLSLLMLMLTGAFDNISVVVRHTLVQLRTPDYMRGRVSAVNSVFIGTSNELGGFESGLVAALFGPVVSVVVGGIGTIAVVLAVAGVWPQIRQLRSLQDASS
jgi:MFS family permease